MLVSRAVINETKRVAQDKDKPRLKINVRSIFLQIEFFFPAKH